MDKAIIGGILPHRLETVIGQKYLYCTCGKSKDGGLCDGAHKGTRFTPKAFIAARERSVLCTCKRTKEAPFCSGAHRGLSEEDIGNPA